MTERWIECKNSWETRRKKNVRRVRVSNDWIESEQEKVSYLIYATVRRKATTSEPFRSILDCVSSLRHRSYISYPSWIIDYRSTENRRKITRFTLFPYQSNWKYVQFSREQSRRQSEITQRHTNSHEMAVDKHRRLCQKIQRYWKWKLDAFEWNSSSATKQ